MLWVIYTVLNAVYHVYYAVLFCKSMDARELEAYRYQLEQVEAALISQPHDEQLLKLHRDLDDLIKLSTLPFSSSLTQPSSNSASDNLRSLKAPPSSQPVPNSAPRPTARSLPITLPASLNPDTTHWSPGDWILAKWSGDGKWYPAKVTSIGGSLDARVYSVQFKGYQETEIVRHEDTRAKASTLQQKEREVLQKSMLKRPNYVFPELGEEEAKEKQLQKKKKPKKESEHVLKQKAWLEFSKGGNNNKKKLLNKKSIFGTEGVAKVGVIGSGRPMTAFAERNKYLRKLSDEIVQ